MKRDLRCDQTNELTKLKRESREENGQTTLKR